MLAFLYGGYMIRDGVITVGTLVAFTAFQVQVIAPIQNLLGQYLALRKGRASLDRVFEFFDVPVEADEEGAEAFEALREGIVFDGVSFSYDGQARVLDGLSLFIPAGRTTAIVESGGEIDLIDLLLRFHEPQGSEIRYDGVPPRLNRSRFAAEWRWSPRPFLSRHRGEYPLRDQVRPAPGWKAAAKADLQGFLGSLPDGLETVVGERGTALSAGQKQRVALARAFLRSPDILILDEATSSLDVLTEERVRASIRELMKGRTILVVTHRLTPFAMRQDRRPQRRVHPAGDEHGKGTYRTFLRICSDAAGTGKDAPDG
jgi:ABC-type multidrug transport system fused ATPase/permease subunit